MTAGKNNLNCFSFDKTKEIFMAFIRVKNVNYFTNYFLRIKKERENYLPSNFFKSALIKYPERWKEELFKNKTLCFLTQNVHC